MPADPVIVAGTKLFRSNLRLNRVNNKVLRLEKELRSAREAQATANTEKNALARRANPDVLEVASVIWDGYWA